MNSTDRTGSADASKPDALVGPDLSTQNASGVVHRRLVWATFAIAAATLLLDQGTKIWALHALAYGRRIEVLGEFLSFRLLFNPGAAFGLGYGNTWLLTIIVVAIIAAMVRFVPRIRSVGWAWAFGLMLGGALGNLIDRLFRAPGFGHGHVIDFIAYWNWFVGNVADIAIVVAAALIVLLTFFGIHIDGTRENMDSRDGADVRVDADVRGEIESRVVTRPVDPGSTAVVDVSEVAER